MRFGLLSVEMRKTVLLIPRVLSGLSISCIFFFFKISFLFQITC